MRFTLIKLFIVITWICLLIFFGCFTDLTDNSVLFLKNTTSSTPSGPNYTPTPTRTPFPSVTVLKAVIQNDTFWKDTYNSPIYSQGGGVFKFGNTYYWYGVKYQGAITYYNNPTSQNTNDTFIAVTCYASQDLINWEFKNDVFTTFTPGLTFNSDTWFGRMGVVYHAGTQKYILVSQYSGPSGTGIMFATCSTPDGNFAFNNLVTYLPITNTMTGDQTLFQDDDGKAYLICSCRYGRAYLYVIPLRSSDFLAFDAPVLVFYGEGREGNCMFKYKGNYYFCSSDLHGWNASHCYYIWSTSITGPYSASVPPDSIMGGTDADFSHVTQTGFFITVTGSEKTTVIFCGDRWADFAGNGIGYNQWCPLSFDPTTDTIPQFNSVSEWTINAATGNWSVGSGNNYILNPGFEADRVGMKTPAGWTTTTDLTGIETPHSNANSGHTGRWYWQMYYSTAYEGTISQVVKGLPNATYTLSVWVMSSGGQASCQLFAGNYNGTDEQVYNINTTIAFWTKITIPNITVTNGQCEVGIRTAANAGNWCRMDDFTLTVN